MDGEHRHEEFVKIEKRLSKLERARSPRKKAKRRARGRA